MKVKYKKNKKESKEGDLVVIRNILLTPFNLAVSKLCSFHLLVLGRGEKRRRRKKKLHTAGDFVVDVM
jgi:hypothetical protein